ncbi:hypothetical protein B0H13DRAFT_2362950 [Mycena leptocephala]|nr:hypothetical protein B0H13DRAFT_2362950 [Mycena leptocephala]
MSVRTGIRCFVDGDASHRTRLLVKALLDCGMGPTLLGCGRCARGGHGAGSVSPGVIAQVALTSAIPILEAKNASTPSLTIARRPFRLYIVNIVRLSLHPPSARYSSPSYPSPALPFLSLPLLALLARRCRPTNPHAAPCRSSKSITGTVL